MSRDLTKLPRDRRYNITRDQPQAQTKEGEGSFAPERELRSQL